ncbi:MAG: M23 family metallopeptidase [Acidimicrobiales bacterium]|nr:M23 family metallopeptidase [Hyphomonadaceae bacterium]RZV42126.1 MAG: M23 family metallopeptidase [Acidimicrobiales bacterium]
MALAIGLIACSQAEVKAEASDPVLRPVKIEAPVEHIAQVESAIDHAVDEKTVIIEKKLECDGVFKQGGAVLCKTAPHAKITVDGTATKADENGNFVFGLDRDAPQKTIVKVFDETGQEYVETLDIALREYDIQRIDGLPPSQVSTFTEEQLKHIKASSARKKVGLSSRSKEMGFRDGFTMAVSGIKSSDFGNQRILNGEPKRPHYGIDIAAPEGTPIYAPADGVISLADDDLYFEGAMVLIDHGQGLISMYLHMSDIDVKAGQKVKRGDQIGAVGAKGRATGPHLCWRLKWRNRNLDPELLTQWPHD